MPPGAGSSMSAIYSNSGQIRLRLDVLCANSGYGIASRQPAITGPAHRCLHHPFAKTGNVTFARLQRQLHRPVPIQSQTLQWDHPRCGTAPAGSTGRTAGGRPERRTQRFGSEYYHRDLPKTYERERGSVSQSPRPEAASVMAERWSFDGELSGQNRPLVENALTCRLDRLDVHSN
jgi:hypothetical protein